jgi:hypothetical protein
MAGMSSKISEYEGNSAGADDQDLMKAILKRSRKSLITYKIMQGDAVYLRFGKFS